MRKSKRRNSKENWLTIWNLLQKKLGLLSGVAWMDKKWYLGLLEFHGKLHSRKSFSTLNFASPFLCPSSSTKIWTSWTSRLLLSQQQRQIQIPVRWKALSSWILRSCQHILARNCPCPVASGRRLQLTCLFFRRSKMKRVQMMLIAIGIMTIFVFIPLRTLKTSYTTHGNLMNWNSVKNTGLNMGNSMLHITIKLTSSLRSSKKWWPTFVVWWHLLLHQQKLLSMQVLQNLHWGLVLTLLRHTPLPSPFHPAAVDLPPQCATALFVLSKATMQPNMQIACCLSSSKAMERQHGPNTVTKIFSPLTIVSSASVGTSEVTVGTHAPTKTSVSTSAPSAGANLTTPSLGHATCNLQIDAFVNASLSNQLSYSDFSSSIIAQPPLHDTSSEESLLFDRILHPYNADAFESLLHKHNLLNDYPLLPYNLCFGFPIGHMPPLSQTVVMANNPSTIIHSNKVSDYLTKEVSAGRISGPFSRELTEQILCGPFQSSSLIVSLQPQEPWVPDKLRVCQHLSKATKFHASVNSHIYKDDFPM